MLNEATLQFVSRHTHDDVRMLAFRGCKDPDVDLSLALQQIAGRQTARRKLPSWAAIDGIVYPPHLNMEQCSSELTARYKARIVNSCSPESHRLLDLTGGFGVDFAFMATAFPDTTYVERDEQLCAIATHNFSLLGLTHVPTVCADAESFCQALSSHQPPSVGEAFIYLDPARRDTHGGRTYALADCTPNVVTMMPALLAHADYVMLKLSPMLDWRKAVADLAPHHVSQIHIVAVDNECKELLLLLSHDTSPLCLTCADISSRNGSVIYYSPRIARGAYPLACPPETTVPVASASPACPPDGPAHSRYLYEPNAAVMKAGCFHELAADFGIAQISVNSHLFTADRLIDEFPGRRFRIEAACSMNKRELRATLGHLRQANIAVRNFPLSAEQLRTRLKLSDGGIDYIFATTLPDNSHILFLCQKAPAASPGA